MCFDNSWPCSDPNSGRPATWGLGGATDSRGLEPPEGKRPTASCLSTRNQLPSWRTELWESWGSGRFVPLMVMHGFANSLHEAVNSGAAAAAALQALRNAGLWSLLQISTICSAEHVSFLHDTHSLLPRWQRGERQQGPEKGGKTWPGPFLKPTHSPLTYCLCGGRALVRNSVNLGALESPCGEFLGEGGCCSSSWWLVPNGQPGLQVRVLASSVLTLLQAALGSL